MILMLRGYAIRCRYIACSRNHELMAQKTRTPENTPENEFCVQCLGAPLIGDSRRFSLSLIVISAHVQRTTSY